MQFQSNNREVDLALARELYTSSTYRLNDFLFNMGTYDFIIASAKPEKTLGYATLLKAFDINTWILIGISVTAVTVTMVFIEYSSAKLIGNYSTKSIHQCMLSIAINLRTDYKKIMMHLLFLQAYS